MFGIPDPGIWMAYLLGVVCVIFAVWYGIKYWNEEDESEDDAINNKPSNE